VEGVGVRMIALGPSHEKLNKGYLSNPKLVRREERPENLSAPELRNGGRDTGKRQEPAWENFNKGFYRFITNDKTMAWKITPLKEDLYDPIRGTKIGDRKYFPAVSTEWKNTIYEYNRNNVLKNLPAFDLRINQLIRHYFKLGFKHKLIHDNYYTRRKRLLFLNKIYTSKAEIKHTNTKAVVTVYLYNREKSVLFKKIKKLQDVTFSHKKLARFFSTAWTLVSKNIKKNKKKLKLFSARSAARSDKCFSLIASRSSLLAKNTLFKNIYFYNGKKFRDFLAPLVLGDKTCFVPQPPARNEFEGRKLASESFISEPLRGSGGWPSEGDETCTGFWVPGLDASEARGGMQIFSNKFKWKYPWNLKLYKNLWSLITKFKNNHITYEDLKKKLDLCIRLNKLGKASAEAQAQKKSKQEFLKALASTAELRNEGSFESGSEDSKLAFIPSTSASDSKNWVACAGMRGLGDVQSSSTMNGTQEAASLPAEASLDSQLNKEEFYSFANESRFASFGIKQLHREDLMQDIVEPAFGLRNGYNSKEIPSGSPKAGCYKLLQEGTSDSKSRTLEYLSLRAEKEDLLVRDLGRLKAGDLHYIYNEWNFSKSVACASLASGAKENPTLAHACAEKDLKQKLQAKEKLLEDLILNLRLFRKLKLNFHLNKSKFEEKLLYRLKNLIIQYYNKKVEFNFVNLKSLIFNSDLFTYILTLKIKKEKDKPRIIRLMKFILNKAKMPEIGRNKFHVNWEYEQAPGGKNIKLRLLNNNKSNPSFGELRNEGSFVSVVPSAHCDSMKLGAQKLVAGFQPRSGFAHETLGYQGASSDRGLETKLSFILGRNYTSLSKLLNMLYFNASAIYGGEEASLPEPLAYEINSLDMRSLSSLLRAGEKQIKSIRNTFRTSNGGTLASEILSDIEPSEAIDAEDDYLMRISWANYKRTWSKTSAYALNYFIFNSINYKNMGGVRLEVSGRLTKRYRADRAVYKMLLKGGLKNIDSSFQGKSSVVFRGFRDPNVQYSWFKSKRRIGSFAVKGWSAGRYSTLAYRPKMDNSIA
jgi:hypothetical protein